MLKKIPLKTKIYISIILCIISILIIIYNGYENRIVNKNNSKSIQGTKGEESKVLNSVKSDNGSNAQIVAKPKEEEKGGQVIEKQDNSVKKEEDDNKVQKREEVPEKNNKLDDKYQEGFNDFHNNNYKSAIEIENEVINADDNYYKAYSIRGIAKCYSGNYDDGMKDIDKSLEIKGDYGYGRFNKALALELYEHFDEALVCYDKALEIEEYAWSYYGKASIYGRRGDVQNTVLNLKKAIELDDSAKVVARTEKDFNNVRSSKEFQQLIGD